MLLRNVTLWDRDETIEVAIKGEKITVIGKRVTAIDDFALDFTDAVIFPGLINSHDHLDFNCFTPLGDKKYSNYTEWGHDIHRTYRQRIQNVLKVPQRLRATWGMYKNLLAGITSVVHHGDIPNIPSPLINIHRDAQSLHSVRFQKKWKWKLNNPFIRSRLCVIHAGEGVDAAAADEIDELLSYNFFGRKLVGVHGLAMNGEQAQQFAAVIWCPESNRILFNKHADIETLKVNTSLVFGTDSTLTGSWDIWDHLRLARGLQLVNDNELFDMVTISAANLWGLNNGELAPGKDADIVIAKKKNSFFDHTPEDILLVMQGGSIRLFDSSLQSQLNGKCNDFSSIRLGDATKFIAGDLPGLISTIQSYSPDISFPVDYTRR